MIDKRPALIARCDRRRTDVAAVIRFAREHDLPLAVRGGGHNGARARQRRRRGRDRPVADEGDLGRPGHADRPRRRRGLWGEVDAATQPHALAVPTGIISTTGVGRADARRRPRVPDAPSRPDDRQPALGARSCSPTAPQVTASADENPDLFWAIRGGGGNFGVVTEFTFRAHPLETIVGGPTFWALEDTDELLARLPRVAPVRAAERDGLLQLPHDPAGAEPFPEELHLRPGLRDRLVHRRHGRRGAGQGDGADALRRRAAHARRRPDADRGAERRVRRPLQPRRPVVLARRLRPRDPRRGDQRETASGTRRCRAFKCGSHLYPIDGAAHDVASRGHRVRLPRRDLVAGVHRRRRRPGLGVRRCATGRSATTRRSTRTRRAAPTSTS